jgi:RNA polymerase subunit RPABC4/transcription elongation factor Spt4
LTDDRIVLARLDALAADVGRLRRRFASHVVPCRACTRLHGEDQDTCAACGGAGEVSAWSGAYIVDRIADHIAALDVLLHPCAAELAVWTAPGDEEAVSAAIETVDRRAAELRRLLGSMKAAA